MIRRTLLLCSIGVAALAAAPTAMAASGGGICQLDGNAYFDRAWAPRPSVHVLVHTGKLTNCQASPGQPAVTSGDVSAGRTITVGGVTYNEPKASGTAAARTATPAATAFVQWNKTAV